MKIAVVAANGRTGRAFVKAAIEEGYEVRAGVRGKHKFTPSRQLEVVPCDATDLEDVMRLVEGCDAVVNLIGHVKKSPAFVKSTATTNILSAMAEHKIKKIVSIASTAARMPGDTPNLVDILINMGIAIFYYRRLKDSIIHLEVLRQSDVNWTVLRVLGMTNGPFRQGHLTLTGPAELTSTRKEIADTIIDILQTDEYDQKAPILSRH